MIGVNILAAAALAAQASPAPATAPARPAATGAEVASIVDGEFPAYDGDHDGRLSQAEFAAWMVALKTVSDPSTRADAPAVRQWVGAAFAQADADGSRSLTRAELTGFLTQGAS